MSLLPNMPTEHSLYIVIVGAGLGGLASALALAKQGHRITVLEAARELVTAGAGIQIPPPSTRIIRFWGLEDKLLPFASKPKTASFRDCQDGYLLGAIPLNPFCERRYGSPWWTIHRADYQRILLEAAVAVGVEIKLDHSVIEVDVEGTRLCVRHGESTESIEADLIIGADGLRSTVRGAVTGDIKYEPRPTSICAYRALVPLDAMNADQIRKPLMDFEDSHVEVWLGDGHQMLSYPVRPGPSALYNLVLVHPEKDEHTKHDLPPRFPRPASIPEVSAHFENFCAQARSVISVITPEEANNFFIQQTGLAPKDGILEWKLADLAELPKWSSEKGTVVLVGDSAHAQRPYMSAGASCAIEDAVALSVLLNPSAIAGYGLPKLVRAYEQLRKPRTSKMQALSAADSGSWAMPAGQTRERRDALLGHLGDDNRQAWACAMAQMKDEGIGEFNFGDPEIMDWAWDYDVREDAQRMLESMN